MDTPSHLDDFYIGSAVAKIDDLPVLMDKLKALTAAELAPPRGSFQLDTVYFLKGCRREAFEYPALGETVSPGACPAGWSCASCRSAASRA